MKSKKREKRQVELIVYQDRVLNMCQFYFEKLSLKNENIPSAAIFYCWGVFFYCLWVCLCVRCRYMGCICVWTEEVNLTWCFPPYSFEAESLTEPGTQSFRLSWKLQAASSSPLACSHHYWSCRLAWDHAGIITCVLRFKLWGCCLGYLGNPHCGYLRWCSKY